MLQTFFFILSLLFASVVYRQTKQPRFSYSQGGIVRGDSTKKSIALVFTADEFGEGLATIHQTLKKQKVKGGFFFTGRFYSNAQYRPSIQALAKEGHYFGPHSNDHLLYCDWAKRDSLLITKDSFDRDMDRNIAAMIAADLPIVFPQYFIPPYEWWNDSISTWSKAKGLQVVSFTPGIRTNADYTWPELGNSYKSNEWLIAWLKETVANNPGKLNGSLVLIHAGTDPRRKEKLYDRLDEIIVMLKKAGYQFQRIDSLLQD
ncbi:MAG TPA: polysaccharide deacetylase family protein [Flavisolibacter sp.]|nr:polysaccharide deacetylase family protein [Flavisolibacter sp.]